MQHNNPHLSDATVHPTGDAQPPKPDGEEEDEEPPIDMTFPTSGGAPKMILYILSFPLMAPLYLTLPDMKNKEFTIFPSFKLPGINV